MLTCGLANYKIKTALSRIFFWSVIGLMTHKDSSNVQGLSPDEVMFTVPRRQFIQHLSLAAITGMLLSPHSSAADEEAPQVSASKPLQPFYLPPQRPLTPGPGGLDIRTWVRSSQTNGQFSCVESAVAPRQMGPAPHLHKGLDEIMFVLGGTATVWIDGQIVEIKAGGWHLRPRQIPHTFWNGSDQPLNFIDMYFNQNFVEELFHHIIPDMLKNQLSPSDPGIVKRIDDLNRRFGVVMFPEKRQPLIERYGLTG
jgi:mannose-6-phosphate isomerase-like protein (cupin superfamily)